MDEFERQLQNVMARREPPAWFEAKVLAAARQPAPKAGWWHRLRAVPRLRWATSVAAVLMVASGIAWQRERAAEERVAGEAAKAQLEIALRITSAKLHFIEQRIHDGN